MLAAFLVASPCLFLALAGLAIETPRVVAAVRNDRRRS
jgi:hypothetical protein